MTSFDELPFKARPDLTPYLIHLTKNTRAEDKHSGYDNLVNILRTGQIWGGNGFIKGGHNAACFMDVPFASLKYVLTPENTDPDDPRYEPYGIAITKQLAYRLGCRPVLYLSNRELEELHVPHSELWRVVRLEVRKGQWSSWLHEREWRCKGTLKLPRTIHAVLVKNTKEAQRLSRALAQSPERFKCIPRAVLPCTVICQGLLA